MIVNGASRRSVGFWTKHLANDKKNDRAELKEIRGLAAENLRDGLLEMQEDARNTRLKNFFYQANFNPSLGEELTEEQFQRAFEIFERHRGIPEGTARIVYEHEKEGRVHRHVIWSRVDTETGRAWSDHLDAKVCHAASREISEELGLHRSISPYDKDREGPRPDRAPEPWEMFRGLKTGLDPREIKAEVTRIFRESEHAADFVAGLQQHGYQLVRGDRRDYCILDSAGEVHSLARRIDDIKAKELREYMKPLQREAFPTVERAKAAFREENLTERLADLATVQNEIAWEEELLKEAIKKERKEERFLEPTAKEIRERREAEKRWPISPPTVEPTKTAAKYHFSDAERQINGHRTYVPPNELRGMSATLMKGYKNSKEGYERTDLDAYNKLTNFEETLDRMAVGFARVTKEEAERSQRQAKFANAIGNYSPRFQDGEIVAVRAWSEVRRSEGQIVPPGQRIYKIDQNAARKFVETLGVEKSLSGIEPTKKIMQVKVQERALQESQKWRDIRFENATKGRGGARTMGDAGVLASVGLGKKTGRIIGKTLDTFADMFGSIAAPSQTPEQIAQGERSVQRRGAEADISRFDADRAAERQRELDQANDLQNRENGRER